MPREGSSLPVALGAIGVVIVLTTWLNENAGSGGWGWLTGGPERDLTNWVVTPLVYPIPNHDYYFNFGFFVLNACGLGMIAKGGVIAKVVGLGFIVLAWTKYITGFEFNVTGIPGDIGNAFQF